MLQADSRRVVAVCERWLEGGGGKEWVKVGLLVERERGRGCKAMA